MVAIAPALLAESTAKRDVLGEGAVSMVHVLVVRLPLVLGVTGNAFNAGDLAKIVGTLTKAP